jgi:putative hydrolase of the HAD superfamily
MDRLPEVVVDGARIRSTYPLLHAALAERADVPLERFVTTLRALDRELSIVMHRERREVPTRARFTALLQRLGLDAPDLVETLTDVHMRALFGHVRMLPHHVEVLAALRERVPLAVCSNFTHAPMALQVIERAGLLPHLDEIVISEQVGVRKPRREIFDETVRRLGVAPVEMLHVGDNLDADVAGAAGIGALTAWITRRVRDPHRALQDYTGPLPRLRLHDLAELPALVGAL